eukprot:SAG22_NODE_154_length_17189_cov_38.210064_12_plen_344_part_00
MPVVRPPQDVAGEPPPQRGCPAATLRLCGSPERLGSGWWYSRRRVRLCMYGSPALFVPVWALSYLVWLGKGCMPFMPFVSDFGAAGSPTSGLFAAGMTAAALLWSASFVDVYHATLPSIRARPGTSRLLRMLHLLQPYLGALTAAGIIGVALNPEDERLAAHGSSAGAAFMGGIGYNLITVLVCHSTAGERGRRLPLLMHTAAVGFSMTSYAMMGTLTGAGFMELAHLTAGSNANATALAAAVDAVIVTSLQNQAKHDFVAYCTGQPYTAAGGATPIATLHSSGTLNQGCLFEWTMLLSILGHMLHTTTSELSDWPPPGRAARAGADSSKVQVSTIEDALITP